MKRKKQAKRAKQTVWFRYGTKESFLYDKRRHMSMASAALRLKAGQGYLFVWEGEELVQVYDHHAMFEAWMRYHKLDELLGKWDIRKDLLFEHMIPLFQQEFEYWIKYAVRHGLCEGQQG